MEERFDNNRKWRPGSNTGQDYNTTEQRIWCQMIIYPKMVKACALPGGENGHGINMT